MNSNQNPSQDYHGEFFADVPDAAIEGYVFGSDPEKTYSFGRTPMDGVNVLKFADGAITVEYIPTGRILSFEPEDSEAGWSWARQRAKHCKRIAFHF